MKNNINIDLLVENKGQIKGLPKNPRKINKQDFERLKKSIQDAPEMLDLRELIVYPHNGKYIVIGGNMRLTAARALGFKDMPCKVLADDTSVEKLREYLIKDNGRWGEWDLPSIDEEWNVGDITEWAGLTMSSDALDFELTSDDNTSKDDKYNDFVEKFKPKLTTDDCYTPKEVYKCVFDYVNTNICNLDNIRIIRPFKPNGNYKNENYNGDCIVVDNPPFSILAEIVDYYIANDVKFFLFAPHLTLFNYLARAVVTCEVCNCDVIYENGANVKTSFIHNLTPDITWRLNYELKNAIETAQKQHKKIQPNINYPDNVTTAALLGKCLYDGIKLECKRQDIAFVRKLDCGIKLFGGGCIMSDAQAARAARAAQAARAARAAQAAQAAQAARAVQAVLSEREKEIIRQLNIRSNES